MCKQLLQVVNPKIVCLLFYNPFNLLYSYMTETRNPTIEFEGFTHKKIIFDKCFFWAKQNQAKNDEIAKLD